MSFRNGNPARSFRVEPMKRCAWATREPLISYHDREWGVPLHDDRLLFRVLDPRRRAGRLELGNDPEAPRHVPAGVRWVRPGAGRSGTERKEDRGLDARPRHHPQPLESRRSGGERTSVSRGAKGIRQLSMRTYGDLSAAKPMKDVLDGSARDAQRGVRCALSKDLRRRGFRFVGTTICYALMQAVGMVNDHERGLFPPPAKFNRLHPRMDHAVGPNAV